MKKEKTTIPNNPKSELRIRFGINMELTGKFDNYFGGVIKVTDLCEFKRTEREIKLKTTLLRYPPSR